MEINRTTWVDFSAVPLTQDHGEVIGFHPDWIDQDFNPNGTRIGFINGDGKFYNATWWDYQDTYIHGEPKMPTKYMNIPSPVTIPANWPAAGKAAPAPVDNVALLKWVFNNHWRRTLSKDFWYQHGQSSEKGWKSTDALIQEFINQKTKKI